MRKTAARDQMQTRGERVGAKTVRADREGRPGHRGDGRDEHGDVFAMPCRTGRGPGTSPPPAGAPCST